MWATWSPWKAGYMGIMSATQYQQTGTYPTGYMNGSLPNMQQQNGSIPGTYAYQNGGFSNSMMTGTNGNTFGFRKRMERIDWKKIAAADVDNIARTLDFNTLQDNIMNITFCSIESELDVRMIDPNFLKLFKLAQLTIEYLLHSQDFLSGMVGGLEEKLRRAVEEHEETKKSLEKQQDELNEVKKESHKRKKMLIAQQQMLTAGTNSYHKCAFCPKAFVNNSFLQSHLARRHPDLSGSQYDTSIEPITVQPVKQAPPPPPANVSQGQVEVNELLAKELSEIKERLRHTESQLVEERNARNSSNQKETQEQEKKEQQIKSEFDHWKKDQASLQKKEIENMRNMFLKELKEMNEKYVAAQEAVERLQRRQTGKSNLGAMHDDEDDQKTFKKDMDDLRAQVAQLAQVEDGLKQKLEDKERNWMQRVNEMSKQHRAELEKLGDALERSVSELEKEKDGRKQVHNDYQDKINQMQELLQNSREQQRKLEKEERQKEMMAASERKPVASPRGHIQHPADKKLEAGNDVVAMEPVTDSETEEWSETIEGNSTLGTTGNLTLGYSSLSGTGTSAFSNFTGSLHSKSQRLTEQLKNNPRLLEAMVEELRGNLGDKLEKRGIPRDAEGIPDPTYQAKMQLLKNERQQTAKKFSNFYDIRQTIIRQVDEIAKNRVQQQEASAPKTTGERMTVSLPLPKTSPSPSRTPQGTPQASKKDASRPKPTSGTLSRQPPKPAPRATSPQNRMYKSMSTTMNTTATSNNSNWGTSTGSSTGSYTTTGTRTQTGASANWDSDDDEEEEEEPKQVHRSPTKQQSPTPKPATKQKKPVVLPRKSVSFEDDWDEESQSQSNWDDTSELEEMLKPSIKTKEPQGNMVAQLTKNIEAQLISRGKKPVGGVSTLEMNDRESQPISKSRQKKEDNWDDDDDSITISSLEDEDISPPKPGARSSLKASVNDSVSTNTYGTSAWGTSSKGLSSANHITKASGSAARSSIPSVSDLDSDFSDLDLK